MAITQICDNTVVVVVAVVRLLLLLLYYDEKMVQESLKGGFLRFSKKILKVSWMINLRKSKLIWKSSTEIFFLEQRTNIRCAITQYNHAFVFSCTVQMQKLISFLIVFLACHCLERKYSRIQGWTRNILSNFCRYKLFLLYDSKT